MYKYYISIHMYNLYLKYLRYRIRKSNTIEDFLKVFKNITFFYKKYK